MANTVNTRGMWTEVSAMDSDYDAGEDFPIMSIKLLPGQANDILIVKNGSATGPKVCKLESTDGEPRIEYFFGSYFQPYIDYSDCTLSANHGVVIGIDPFYRPFGRYGADPS